MDPNENEIINVKEFLESRLGLIREDYFLKNKNVRENIKNDMQLPDVAIERLEELCNPRFLNREDDQNQIQSLSDLNSEHLSIIDYVKTHYKQNSKRVFPLEIKFMKNLAKLNEIEPAEDDSIETPDVILNIQVSQALNSKLRKQAWSEDFLVLGQNFLTDLKDKITCFRNEIKVGEFSEDPDQINSASLMKDVIRSGYFLIENILFNDLRDGRTDCGVPVLKWAKERNIGEFQSLPMETTKFIDLNLRLGFPYLFKHLGNCEHLIVFTSIRLVNPSSDCYSKSKYPIIKDKTRGRFTFCWCCNKLYAKWIVVNSKYAVDDPTFLCERCLRNTHYEDQPETSEAQTNEQTEGISEINENQNQNQIDEAGHSEDSENSLDSNKSKKSLKKLFDFKAYHFSQY